MTEVKNRDLRIFSAIIAVGFTLVERIFLKTWFGPLSLAAVLFCLFGLALPRLVVLPYRLWMALGIALGHISSRVILFLVFYLLFTPLSFFFRLVGRDALRLRRRRLDSYWEKYDPHEKTLDRYRRMF